MTAAVAGRKVQLPQLPSIRAEYWDALQTGELIRGTRHATRSAVAAACARAGYSLHDFRNLIDYAESGRALFGSPRLIAKHYRDAVRLVQATPLTADRGQNRRELAMIRSALGAWKGRNAVRDRKLLDAIHAHAHETGLLVLAVPVRTFAITTGMTFERTRRALDALTQTGWLQRTRNANGAEAARYRLALGTYTELDEGVPKRVSRPVGPWSGTTTDSEWHSRVPHDVFQGTEGGLSDRDEHLYRHLGDIPVSVPHLMAVTGMTRRTLFRRLKSLKDAGLALSTPQGYVRVVCDDWDALADRMGVKRVLNARNERYRDEQQHWANAHSNNPDGVLIDAAHRFSERNTP